MNEIIYGLVLSGGGARGIAHVGAIKALEEAGIRPSFISGASAGAIIGALYAADYSVEEMLDFFRNTTLFSVLKYAVKKPGMLDTNKYFEMLKAYFPEDRFDALKKTLYVSATDMIFGKTKYFYDGALIPRILASAAFPGVFSPVRIDDTLYSDGGISNNFPVEPLLVPCDKIIGVFVHPLEIIKAEHLKTSYDVMDRAYAISRANASMEKFDACDLVISPTALNNYGTFSMGRFNEIFQIGYEAAKKKLEEKPLLFVPS